MKAGRQIPEARSLETLRLLGSVGEPINPEAWQWYRQVIGHDRTPIVDTWWQTETGAIMISALPGVTKLKPGAAQTPLPGITAEIVDEDGRRVEPGEGGYLTIADPWPSMARGIWNDPDRFVETYWSRFPGRYFAGDGARLDGQGDIWVQGRVDDVMNVSGHRLSTAEIESALVGHEGVAEAAVVGAADETTGQAVVAFVILTAEAADGVDRDATAKELRDWVGKRIGAIAKPRQVVIVPELPKTRSGKIMRRSSATRPRAAASVTRRRWPTRRSWRPSRNSCSPAHVSRASRPVGLEALLRCGAPLAVRQSVSSTTNSTSTGASSGRTATPTALRAWTPASPKTSPTSVEAPFATAGCPVNDGSDATKTVTFTTRATRSSDPATDWTAARALRAAVRASAVAVSGSTPAPTLPVTGSAPSTNGS